jgi:hypothetical protein
MSVDSRKPMLVETRKENGNHVWKKNDEQLDEPESLKRMQPPEEAEAKYQ